MGLIVDVFNCMLSSSCCSGVVWYVDLYCYDGLCLYLYCVLCFIYGSDVFE